jgi:hypothetical protein
LVVPRLKAGNVKNSENSAGSSTASVNMGELCKFQLHDVLDERLTIWKCERCGQQQTTSGDVHPPSCNCPGERGPVPQEMRK